MHSARRHRGIARAALVGVHTRVYRHPAHVRRRALRLSTFWIAVCCRIAAAPRLTAERPGLAAPLAAPRPAYAGIDL